MLSEDAKELGIFGGFGCGCIVLCGLALLGFLWGVAAILRWAIH